MSHGHAGSSSITSAIDRAMVFEPWSDADIDAVLAIETSVAAFPWTRGHFTDSWKAGYSGWVGRDPDRRLLGYYLLMPAVDEIHLLNLGVDRSVHRQGLGSRLLGHALGNAWQAGGRSMFLEVRPSNRPAIALYERFGFSEVGQRRGYYPAASGREDAIVMRRAVSGADFEACR
jgi:[ribosomal protein S18]-alanine N-acetyltransferase